MNRSEFKELESQFQQSGLSLKSYLEQAGVSYATYYYWHKKCSGVKDCAKEDLAPISLKQSTPGLYLEERVPQGVSLLFPNGLRAHFGNGSEKVLIEVLTQSLRGDHV